MGTLLRRRSAVAGLQYRKLWTQLQGVWRLMFMAMLVLLSVALACACQAQSATEREPGSTAGQCLVASRQMTDPHFARTIIYMVAHDGEGAFGVVVNRRLSQGSLQMLLDASNIPPLPAAASIRLYAGGPVQPQRAFILHSADYSGDSTIALGDGLAFSTGRDVVEALGAGRGPKNALVILGYAGWASGQLDSEIARGDWLLAPAKASYIFDDDPDTAWERVLAVAGIPL